MQEYWLGIQVKIRAEDRETAKCFLGEIGAAVGGMVYQTGAFVVEVVEDVEDVEELEEYE